MNEEKPKLSLKGPKEKLYKKALVSLTPLAYKKYQQIPMRSRSKRISRFLERCDPNLDIE